MTAHLHLKGSTTHARRGSIGHAFSYPVDYVMIDPDARGSGWLSRNRFSILSVHDKDHGGKRRLGHGAEWAKRILGNAGVPAHPKNRLRLLTLPRVLGMGFCPVSFWLQFRGEDLIAVIAEVNNTFGDRHSYLCHRPSFEPIGSSDAITVDKAFHVSPFQDIAGTYRFNFRISSDRVAIRISHTNGEKGVEATLVGDLKPLTLRSVLQMLLRFPSGPIRTIVLIHWHAARLKLKGAVYRTRPEPPKKEVSP